MDLLRRRRRWLLLAAATAVAGYGAYRAYHHPAITAKRRRLTALLKTLTALTEALSTSADSLRLLSNDFNRFLRADSSAAMPPSLRQLSRLAVSDELTRPVTRLSESITNGILNGLSKPEKPAGNGQNLWWVDLISNYKIRPLVLDCVKASVGTLVTVYLDKTIHLNAFDDLFSGLANPKHEKKVRETLVSVFNGAVETLVRTSHEVLTCSGGRGGEGEQDKGFWDRGFVLDLTGRVTAETVKSFLDLVPGRGAKVVGEEIVEKGKGVVRYFAAKSVISVTVCLAVCLHLFSQTRMLVPA